jgi:hypothetical protein
MNKKIIALLISSLFLITIIPLTVTSQNTNKTIYVDDDNISGPWDGSIDYPYQFIQDANQNARDGDTVFVYNGIYKDNLFIINSINFIGENTVETIINPINSSFPIITTIVNNVTINGFTINGSNIGIRINSSYNLIKNNKLINNNF